MQSNREMGTFESHPTYRITRTIEIDLTATGPFGMTAAGATTIVMDGAGPAFRFVGTHGGTGDPGFAE